VRAGATGTQWVGDNRCDGEPVGDSRRDRELDRFIAPGL
jgi:hypothetical protein